MKRTVSLMLVLSILISVFTVVSATVDESSGFSYDSNLDLTTTVAQQTGLGVNLGSTKWRSVNSDEGLMGGDSTNPAPFKVDNKALYLYSRNGGRGTTDIRYNTKDSNIPALVYNTPSTYLTGDQTIEFTTYLSHVTCSSGVRFKVHNNGQNYYAVVFGGEYVRPNDGGSDRIAYKIYKYVDGAIVAYKEVRFANTGLAADNVHLYMSSDATIQISCTGNVIRLTAAQDERVWSDSWTDSSPFTFEDEDTATVWFTAAGANNDSRFVKFSNIKINSVESNVVRSEYRDDFSGYREATYTGLNTNMQGNWRTANENELNSTYATVPVGFGNGHLNVYTNTNTVDLKYTTVNATKFPTAVLTATCSELPASQRISMKVKKTHGSDMWGVRFYVHNGSSTALNYYTLFFGGMYTRGFDTTNSADSGYLTWGLYKSTNGTITTLKEKTRSAIGSENHVDGYMGDGIATLNIEILGNKITWNLSYDKSGTTYTYSDAYVDEHMFQIDGANTTVHLYAAGSNNSSRYVYFDDFVLEPYVPYITSGEPDDVIYYDVSEGKQKNSDGVIDLGNDVVIRKLLYNGGSENGEILISKDNQTWNALTNINEFADGKFVNCITDDSYRYISMGEADGNLTVLTDISELEGVYTDDATKLYPRIGGIDYFSDNDNVFTTDDEALVKINGSHITPGGVGTANVIASVGERAISIPVTYSNGIYSYYDSFDNSGTTTFAGQNVQFDKAWRSKTESEGKMGYNNDAAIGYNSNRIFVQARGIKDGDSYSRYPRWADTVPAAVFNADHKELTQNQIIKTKITKTSGTESSGVKFMVHNNGNSYYLLLFPGMYGLGGLTDKDSNYSSWELLKCDGGQYTMLARSERNGNNADTETGYLSWATGDLTITYVDGKITWSMPVYNGSTKLYEWSGEYQDAEPYTLSGNDVTVWLISGLYSGDNPSRGTYFDDVKIASYVPYVTADEPKAVLYQDLLEHKNLANGICELDEATHIRRVIAKNVSDSLTVFASNDNDKWYKLCVFDADGEYLNDAYAEAFKYIKTVGNGEISVLSEITDSGMQVKLGETSNVYPYVSGALYAEPIISEETGCIQINGCEITGKSAIKNDIVTVDCGTIQQEMKVTVPLVGASYELAQQGDDAMITVTAEELTGINSEILVTFYQADHSLGNIVSFAGNFDDGTETITIEDFYAKGTSAKLMIWNDSINAAPYTKVIDLNMSKQN